MRTLSSNELDQVSGGINAGPLGDPEVDFVGYMKNCVKNNVDPLSLKYKDGSSSGVNKIYEAWCNKNMTDPKKTVELNHWNWVQ